MREFVRYIENLTNTIKAQQKGLRRLSRKCKRLQTERDEYRNDAAYFHWCAMNREIPAPGERDAEYEQMHVESLEVG